MLAPGQVADGQVDALAALPANGSLRPCTRRTTWPSPSWLDTRRAASRRKIEVDLVGRSDIQAAMRPFFVVQLPTRVITRPRSDESVTRGIRCTGRKSPYEAGRQAASTFFVAKSAMMTSGTTVRSRSGCSIRSCVPRCFVRRDRTLPGRRWSNCGACSMSLGRQMLMKR